MTENSSAEQVDASELLAKHQKSIFNLLSSQNVKTVILVDDLAETNVLLSFIAKRFVILPLAKSRIRM